jgi:alpha-beta hydrolase superfamily lysophospholipase
MPMRQKRWMAIGVTSAVMVTLWFAWPWITTATFLMDLAGASPGPTALLPASRRDVAVETYDVNTREGPVTVRSHAPRSRSDALLILVPGVHGGGIDEPRLDRFARRVAANGLTVLTVPLPDLRAFAITGRSADVIEDVVKWAAGPATKVPAHAIGLVGASFAGGLALVAAGRPAIADRLRVVVSIGGHGSLERVLDYLCTGTLPDGTRRVPHDYGVSIVTLTAVPLLVPPEQVPRLSAGIRAYLDASVDETPEQADARRLLAFARTEADEMPEPSHSIMGWVNDHDVEALGRVLRPHIAALAADPRLSPERSPLPTAPVYLLQGSEDNVIPSSETPRLANYLRQHGHTRVRELLTPTLTHIGFNTHVPLTEQWRLVSFWRAVKRELE